MRVADAAAARRARVAATERGPGWRQRPVRQVLTVVPCLPLRPQLYLYLVSKFGREKTNRNFFLLNKSE